MNDILPIKGTTYYPPAKILQMLTTAPNEAKLTAFVNPGIDLKESQ